MKRISTNVAVSSLLSTIPNDHVIKIADVDRYKIPFSDPWENADSSIGLTYTVDEILHNYEYTKIAKAKIFRTAINEGMLLLVIDTQHEEY